METLRKVDILFADCRRDVRVARTWGYRDGGPVELVPGSGGVKTALFWPEARSNAFASLLGASDATPCVANPRGFRDYVCIKEFFQAAELVLRVWKDVVFVCADMASNPIALRLATRHLPGDSVRLLPKLNPIEMAAMFARSMVFVSPTLHDGTPNTLLEGMACGSFPVAGNIESIREWILDGENGLLCNPECPEDLARSMIRALSSGELRRRARARNVALVHEKANYEICMARASQRYLEKRVKGTNVKGLG